MSVLLLRLTGPMQSWGTQSRFTVRDTGLEPSKSGVIGLLCAAIGRRREEAIGDLVSLRMGVRVDREGTMAKDYHTALDAIRASGAKSNQAVVSTRYYLADASFLVGIEGDIGLLKELHAALTNPHWPLYLGRRAFPPAVPVHLLDGLLEGRGLREVLTSYPLCGSPRDGTTRLRLVLECPYGEGEAVRMDQPLPNSFNPTSLDHRRFLPRHTRTDFVDLSEIPGRET